MAHKHFCDIAGHEWRCRKSTCLCVCGKPVDKGDHSGCPIGLVGCPKHLKQESEHTAADSEFSAKLKVAYEMEDGPQRDALLREVFKLLFPGVHLESNAKAMLKHLRNDNAEPHVGIFWLYDGKLILDTSPVSEAEGYGDALTHGTGHDDYWTRLQQQRMVPMDMEYFEMPRGRVGYYKRLERFWLRADRCILKRKNVVRQIKKAMNLPEEILVETDDHYSCSVCESRKRGRDSLDA